MQIGHRDNSRRTSLLSLVRKARFSASEAGRRLGVPDSTARRWVRLSREGIEHRRASSGRRRVSTDEQDIALIAEADRNPFQSASSIKANAQFPGSSRTVIRRLRTAERFPRVAAVKEFITDDHRLFRLAFAEENVDRDWNKIIFSDEVTFSSSKAGPEIVYRPRGSRYDPRYVAHRFSSGRVSVSCIVLGVDVQ